MMLSSKYCLLAAFLISLIFFTYKLDKVPEGLTLDEAAFGYNAVLLSQTYHDENGRFMPAFILSINGKDWRQPVPQYIMAAFFRIFGPSIYNLKLTSAITASISSVLILVLAHYLLGKFGAIISYIIFLFSPIVLIHSHLGLDNLTPLPFILIWLLSFWHFTKNKNLKLLVIAAISLGICFYSYKAMRSFIPVFSFLSLVYLFQNKATKKAFATFIGFLAPFFIVIPYLEYKYAGAVLGGTTAKTGSIYNFFNSFLSSFDISFLFIKGDEILHHSTGTHGMFLLATLPLFLVGLYQAIKKGNFWHLILSGFFLGPILFGFPGSYHRASRLTGLIPFFVLISSLGAVYLYKKKLLFVVFILVFLINSINFLNYYWQFFASDTKNIYYSWELERAYKVLKAESLNKNLVAYESPGFISTDEEKIINNFLRSIYFIKPPLVWEGDSESFPENAIVMTRASDLDLNKLDTGLSNVFFYTQW